MCLVTGNKGFIGSALVDELNSRGANVLEPKGDVREWSTFIPYLETEIDYIFHFGSPSSQVLFKRGISKCVDSTINGFFNCVKLAEKTGAKLIYPSTGLVSQGRHNEYSRCKKILEDLHLNSDLNATGFRIFAGYGEGEAHKEDYASPVYLFIKDMVSGKSPVIWGDGSQTRDFIYIEDLVSAIIDNIDSEEKIVEIGSGKPVSFNEVVGIINEELNADIKPTYIPKPSEYYESTKCNNPVICRVSLREGIKRCIKSLL